MGDSRRVLVDHHRGSAHDRFLDLDSKVPEKVRRWGQCRCGCRRRRRGDGRSHARRGGRPAGAGSDGRRRGDGRSHARRGGRPAGAGSDGRRRGVAVLCRQRLEHELRHGLERVLDAGSVDRNHLVERVAVGVHPFVQDLDRQGVGEVSLVVLKNDRDLVRGRSRWPRGSVACSRSSRGWRRASPLAHHRRRRGRRLLSRPSAVWRCKTPDPGRCTAGCGSSSRGCSRSRWGGSRRRGCGPSRSPARASCPCS